MPKNIKTRGALCFLTAYKRSLSCHSRQFLLYDTSGADGIAFVVDVVEDVDHGVDSLLRNRT